MTPFNSQIARMYSVFHRLTTVPTEVVNQLNGELNSGKSEHKAVQEMCDAFEVTRDVTQMARMYQVCLGRKPDTAGFDLFVSLWRQNAPSTGYNANTFATIIQNNIIGSQEYQTRFPNSMTTAAFVNKLYNEALGRNASANELTNTSNYIDFGIWTRAQALAQFINSPECIGRFDENVRKMLIAAYYNDANAYVGNLNQ